MREDSCLKRSLLLRTRRDLTDGRHTIRIIDGPVVDDGIGRDSLLSKAKSPFPVAQTVGFGL
jgi:hypothetical protein